MNDQIEMLLVTHGVQCSAEGGVVVGAFVAYDTTTQAPIVERITVRSVEQCLALLGY